MNRKRAVLVALVSALCGYFGMTTLHMEYLGSMLFTPLCAMAVITLVGGFLTWGRSILLSSGLVMAALFGMHVLYWQLTGFPSGILDPDSLVILSTQSFMACLAEAGVYMIYLSLGDPRGPREGPEL